LATSVELTGVVASVTVPVNVGEAENTTLPLPVVPLTVVP
jgi:hypothetical protein